MDLEKNKEEYINLLRSSQREGIDNLIDFIKLTDFFEAPASLKYNLPVKGGLCQHSLNVYNKLVELNDLYQIGLQNDAMIIVALLHDLPKADMYEYYMQNKKVDNTWVSVGAYKLKEPTDRAIYISPDYSVNTFISITDYIHLSNDEASAILNYSGNYFKGDVAEIYNRSPLTSLLHMADFAAMYLEENPYKVDE